MVTLRIHLVDGKTIDVDVINRCQFRDSLNSAIQFEDINVKGTLEWLIVNKGAITYIEKVKP